MKKKTYLIGGLIILVALGALGFVAFRGAATYYYTVGEILSKANTLSGQTVRVAGPVVVDSLELSKTPVNSAKFVIHDRDNTQLLLSITYQGTLPDAFKEGTDAVAEGKLNSSGVFEATQIIVKCPSKYEPQATPK
jgi:cytochrome c-type biogenesis protein CcmE